MNEEFLVKKVSEFRANHGKIDDAPNDFIVRHLLHGNYIGISYDSTNNINFVCHNYKYDINLDYLILRYIIAEERSNIIKDILNE
jgi:hypothetical protein